MASPQPTKSPGEIGKRAVKENPKYGTQPGVKTTQKDRQNSVSSGAAASPRRHGAVSPMQSTHDTLTLVRDLLARLVKMEAKVETMEGQRAEMEVRVLKLEKEVESSRVELVGMGDIAEKRREECEKLRNVMDGNEEEMKKERRRLDESEEETRKMKEEMGLVRDDGVRREEALAARLDSMREEEKEEIGGGDQGTVEEVERRSRGERDGTNWG